MKILITEDDYAKRAEIVAFVENLGVDPANILVAIDMADFMAKFDETIAICVIDLRLVGRRSATALEPRGKATASVSRDFELHRPSKRGLKAAG